MWSACIEHNVLRFGGKTVPDLTPIESQEEHTPDLGVGIVRGVVKAHHLVKSRFLHHACPHVALEV